VLLFLAVLFTGCTPQAKQDYVVVYTSQDQFYAEPILRDFTKQTGIAVRAVFDTEAAKTAGLANRLRAEKANPQCDVFWSNEEMHTRLLARDGVIAADGWHAAGFREREMVINTNFVATGRAPANLLELANPEWKGRVVFAYPLFGTTSLHFLALRQRWGEGRWKEWCEALVKNGAKVVDGNASVVRLVGAGEAWIGLTDSDDVRAGQREGKPIAGRDLGSEGLRIRSTVALVQGAPRAALAARLIDFARSETALRALVSAGALDAPREKDDEHYTPQLDWSRVLAEFDQAAAFLKEVFLRS